MNTKTSNISWPKSIVNLLAKKNIKYACISPGSRNTPLTHALIKQKSIKCISHIDERSSAFFGLGISKKTNSPIIILTTSGTATANLLPAIIEAYYSMTPLIIITADRPKRLLNTGENQTIDQTNIYSSYIRGMLDIKVPNKISILKKIDNIIDLSIGNHNNIPGPVHLNIRFDEPLYDSSKQLLDINLSKNIMIKKNITFKLPKFKRPLIVCGELSYSESKHVYKLIKNLDFPVFADINSNLRHYKNIKVFYDYYCNNIKKPDLIIRFGTKPISKSLNKLLTKNKKNTYLIHPHLHFNDNAKHIVRAFPQNILIKNISYKNLDDNWINEIKNNEKNIIKKYDALSKTKNNEISIITSLLNKLTKNEHLFIGNSSPIRSFNKFTGKLKSNIKIFSNRGASGIDGVISTALGISFINNKSNNFLVIGDISFFHDINGFHVLKSIKTNLTIIVINNNGGQIFSTLDYANKNIEKFDEFWITSQKIKINNVANLFSLKYLKLTTKKLKEEISKISKLKGVKIVEIETSSSLDIKIDKELSLV
ncbi:MAG: 2-succinyl-5-enolpyruvyl-6-hydroxy-3-cyclohexene-1-carboxylic-acid synthase [Candidatus Marinimicrobia bacterium]|nr:2-succinyl-5-enolpyruvyl-6-hydroxy-3-cyclohexene-1-carboxylic-acid synthase [Candidatus Neomarinimicrobiota bacterium]